MCGDSAGFRELLVSFLVACFAQVFFLSQAAGRLIWRDWRPEAGAVKNAS
jgi:hypothetical protein